MPRRFDRLAFRAAWAALLRPLRSGSVVAAATLIAFGVAAAAEPHNAPALHLKFDEKEGGVARDSSGNGLDGTLSGSAAFAPAGKIDGAVNGGRSGVVVAPNRLVELGDADFSVAFWVNKMAATKLYADIDGVGIWEKGKPGDNQWVFSIGGYNSDIPAFHLGNVDGGGKKLISLQGIRHLSIGAWHHLAVVRRRDLLGLYFDGVLVNRLTVGTVSVNGIGKTLRVGQSLALFDDVRLYRRALSAEEIRELTRAPRPAAPEPVAGPLLFPAERQAMRDAYADALVRDKPVTATTSQEWEAEKKRLRKQALADFGLDPAPGPVPLNLTWGDKLEREDCTIWMIAYQSFPGLYVTAALTMPKKATFPAPAIIRLMGHEPTWERGTVGPMWARRGYIVLSIKTEHVECPEIPLTSKGVQLWNNIRGLDLLCSLPEVDARRIGAYGSSGGGGQSAYLAAMDERVAVESSISGAGGHPLDSAVLADTSCTCNRGPLHMPAYDFCAMIAPRPQAVMCTTSDAWLRNSMDDSLPGVARVYELYRDAPPGPIEAPARDGLYRSFTDATGHLFAEYRKSHHAWHPEMYRRTAWLFDWWLRGIRKPFDANENLDIDGYGHIFYPADWIGHAPPLLNKNLDAKEVFDTTQMKCVVRGAKEWNEDNLREAMAGTRTYSPPAIGGADELRVWQTAARSRLTELLGESGITYGEPRSGTIMETVATGDWSVERLTYPSEPPIRIPSFLIRRKDAEAPPRPPVTVMMLRGGKSRVFDEPYRARCQAELDAGRAVLVIDPRWVGEWSEASRPDRIWKWWAHSFGRPLCGLAVSDVRASLDYLAARPDLDGRLVRLFGLGEDVGVAALFAAALDDRVEECVCDLAHADLHRVEHHLPVQERRPEAIIPGMIGEGNLDAWAALVAPRKLTCLRQHPQVSFAFCDHAYALLGANANLHTTCDVLPLINGDFDHGEQGWRTSDGKPVPVTTDSPHAGTAALALIPGQTVISSPFALKPRHAYALHLQMRGDAAGTGVHVFLTDPGDPGGRRRFGTITGTGARYVGIEAGFLARLNQREGQLEFEAFGDQSKWQNAPIRIDSVWIGEGEMRGDGAGEDKELISAQLSSLAAGEAVLKPWGKGAVTDFILNTGGKGMEIPHEVIAAEGGKWLQVTAPAGKHAGVSVRVNEPLQSGCLYRFRVSVKGRGKAQLRFYHTGASSDQRNSFELTDERKDVTLDYFVDGLQGIDPLPAVEFGENTEVSIYGMSLKRIAAVTGEMRQADPFP